MTSTGRAGRGVSWVRAHASTLALLAISFFVAFWQRPFEAFSDTRVELAADPAVFLGKVANLWNETYDLGSIQASQFVGYAFPMGPYFAVGDGLGIPIWILQRLWIGVLLFLAAYGTSRVVDSFFRSRRTGAGLIAGALMIANPYVLVVLNRGSAWLLAYAALPWLLVWTQRGTREPNRWLYPAAFALTFAASGAGTNAAVAFWPLAASALLMVGYALFTSSRNAWTFAWKAALCSVPVALWWVVPVLAQVRFGTDYLTFTEHAETILNTSSASEALRLLGYWVGYINGYPEATPFIPSITSYLLSKPTVMVTLLLPAFAIASGALVRDRRPAIFFSALLAFGVIVMSLGFPQEGAIGAIALDLYYDSGPLLFLRTTYKAAPLVALSISVLAGVGAAAAIATVRSLRISIQGRPFGTAWIWAPLVGVLVVSVILWGRPLFSGRAVDERLFFGAVPPAWVEALDDSQAKTPPDTRIAVLPGDLYGWYTWGGTLTSVAPGLSERPVLVRQVLRAPPPNSAQLLGSVDQAIQLDRLVPGQLPPLLRLMGVGRVLVGSDSSTLRGEAIDAARASRVLAGQPGFERPADRYGPVFVVEPPKDRAGGPIELSQVRAYDTPRPAQPRITRVQPAAGAQVVDGDANGVVALAAVGSLEPEKALFYAGSLDDAELDRVLRDSPTLTFTDSNRRRYVLGTRVAGNIGPTLTADEPIARIFPGYDPFPRWGSSAQTVAVYGGIREVSSPASPSFSLFPEHRPFAALDGDTGTTWIAQSDEPSQRYMDVVLRTPTRVPEILLRPHMDQVAATRKVAISADGGPETLHTVTSGWNRLPVSSAPVTRIRIRVIAKKTILGLSVAGIDEVRIPGVRTTEALRLPTLMSERTSGADLSRIPLRVVLERATADFPRRSGIPTGPAFALDPADMEDAESGMRRIVTLPAERRFTPDGWASVRPEAPDPILDTLAGAPGGARYSSSSRLEGLPAFRASSAFDGNPRTGWAAEIGWRERPWVRVERDEPFTVSRLRLLPLPGRYRAPTRAQVGSPRGSFEVSVDEDGRIELPRSITTDSLTVRIIGVRRAARTQKGRPVPRAVGVAELQAPEIPRTPVPRRGSFTSNCGAATVRANGRTADLQVSGSVQDMDRGTALRLKACGGSDEIPLRRGASLVTAPPGAVFATDFLQLQGDPPSVPPSPTEEASITPSGEVRLDGAGWLVLGQSFSPAWKAQCRDSSGNERDLGTPTEIDGFANGWRIDGGTCTAASFSFGPQAGANIAYVISLGAALFLALIAFVSWRRQRGRGPAGSQPPSRGDQLELRIGAGDTLAELSASSVTGTRQSSGRLDIVGKALGLGSAGLVVLTAVSYALESGTNDRGVNFEFANQHIVGHWLALAAMVALLGGSACRIAFELRRRTPG